MCKQKKILASGYILKKNNSRVLMSCRSLSCLLTIKILSLNLLWKVNSRFIQENEAANFYCS